MGAADDVQVVQVVEGEVDGGVKVAVGGRLVGLDGGGSTFRSGPFAFLFHVRAPDKLDPGDPPLVSGRFREALDVGQPVVAVQLGGGVYPASPPVVVPHHGFGELINRALQPTLLGINHDGDALFRGSGAYVRHPFLDALPCSVRTFIGLTGPHLLEEGIVGQGADLEHGKGEPVVALCGTNGGDDLFHGRIEGGFSGLALGAVVQDGADAESGEPLGGVHAFGDVLATTEIVEYRLKRPA